MNKKQFQINLEFPQLIPQTISGDWKQLVKTANYGKHPVYGTIEFTPTMPDSFYNNFKNNTVGRELSFNFNHNSKSIAALWIKDLRKIIDSNGQTTALEYLPEYTPEGARLIAGKEYKNVIYITDHDNIIIYKNSQVKYLI